MYYSVIKMFDGLNWERTVLRMNWLPHKPLSIIVLSPWLPKIQWNVSRGLSQSTLFKQSGLWISMFCPAGRHWRLGEHMLNSSWPLFPPCLPPSFYQSLTYHSFSVCFIPLTLCIPAWSFCLFFFISLPNFHVCPSAHPTTHTPSWPPRESSERAWGSSKCGSTSWRETQHRHRRLRAI